MAQLLPLDAWERVLAHVEVAEAVATFDALWRAGVFGDVPRLDAFWMVIASARHCGAREETLDKLPDPEPFRDGVAALVDMGIDKIRATTIMRQAQGSWYVAMQYLGWD